MNLTALRKDKHLAPASGTEELDSKGPFCVILNMLVQVGQLL